MSSFTPLYKTSEVKLPVNTDKWRDFIFDIVSKTHPYLSPYLSGDIDWSVDPIDYQEGNATGAITALIGDTPIQIPIIVRDSRLKDVDLYITPDGEMTLLNKDVVLEYPNFKNVEVGRKIPFDEMLRTGKGFGGSYMSKISSYSGFGRDLVRMKGHVLSDYPGLSDSFDRMKKMASVEDRKFDTISMENSGGIYSVTAFRQGHRVDNFNLDKYAAFANPLSQIAEMARATRHEGNVFCQRKMDKEAFVVETTGGGSPSVRPVSISPGDGAEFSVEQPTNSEHVRVNGKVYTSSTLANIAEGSDLDSSFMIFISNDGGYTMNLPDTAKKSSPSSPSFIEPSMMDRGNSYFLIFKDHAMGPMRLHGITNQDKSSMDNVLYTFQSISEGQVHIYFSESIQEPISLGKDGREFVFPAKTTRVVPIKEELIPCLHGDAEITEKLASTSVDIMFDGDDFFCKYAGLGESIDYCLSPTETLAWLCSLGATEQSGEAVIKTARNTSRKITVSGVEFPYDDNKGDDILDFEKRAEIERLMIRWSNNRDSISKLAEALNPMVEKDMVSGTQEKANEEMKDQQVDPQDGSSASAGLQDNINSINLLNQYNATKFSDARPEIEDAKRVVANLLYKVRTGEMEDLDEDIVKDGLRALDSIISSLKEIASSKED